MHKTEICSKSQHYIQKIIRYRYKRDICKVAYMWSFENRHQNTQMKILKCLFSQLTPTRLYSLNNACMLVDQILCKQDSQKDIYIPHRDTLSCLRICVALCVLCIRAFARRRFKVGLAAYRFWLRRWTDRISRFLIVCCNLMRFWFCCWTSALS